MSDHLFDVKQLTKPLGRLNMKIPPSLFRDYHYKDKTVSRPSYLYNGNHYTWNEGLYIETGPALGQHGTGGRVLNLLCWYPLEIFLVLQRCLSAGLNATKWSPVCRWHFHMHFLEWKCINFDGFELKKVGQSFANVVCKLQQTSVKFE